MKLGTILVRVPRKVKKGQIFKVMSITKHPMDTGLVKNPKTGKIIPMWIINKVDIYYDKKLVTTCDYGIAISANPFFAFYLTPDNGRAFIATRIKIQQDSYVQVVTEYSNGSLYGNREFVKVTVGGC